MDYGNKLYQELIKEVAYFKRLTGDRRDMMVNRLRLAAYRAFDERGPISPQEKRALDFAEGMLI